MTKKDDILIARSLRSYASLMCNRPGLFTKEEGKRLDRALRSCRGISDIDRVWVSWRFYAEQNDWLTDEELIYSPKTGRYTYPPKTYEDEDK